MDIIIYVSLNKVEFCLLVLYYIGFCLFKVTPMDTSSDAEQGGIFFKAKVLKYIEKKTKKQYYKK